MLYFSSFLAGQREMSFEVLNKRKFKTPQIEDILNVLSKASKTETQKTE